MILHYFIYNEFYKKKIAMWEFFEKNLNADKKIDM